MPELILHHYDLSPFSEKIRAMLGYASMSWHSVKVQEMPPRPQLAVLTGGYRRIPVGQIGADIFCDTRIISREIARISGHPQLCLENCDELVKTWVAKADSDYFMAAVLSSLSWPLQRKAMASLGPIGVGKLLIDRIGVGRHAGRRFAGPIASRRLVHEHARAIETRLEDSHFLFGENPCIADFASYHGLWMIREAGEKRLLDDYTRLNQWLDRIGAFGHGEPIEMSATAAIETARQHQPAGINENARQHPDIGQLASIAPADYARDSTIGTVEGVNDERWILSRETSETGLLHIHFPRSGYSVRPA